MGQVLHNSATTTEAVRRAIQHIQESLRALSKRYNVNPKTIAKWEQRTSAADLPTGPKQPQSTVLTVEEEAMVVAFRATHAAAARRLLVCPAAYPAASHTVLAAPLSATTRYLPTTRNPRRQADKEGLQELLDPLLSHRYRGGANRRRQVVWRYQT